MGPSALARLLALLIPAGLLGGALGSQYIGGLYPCEMCWWQRYAHFAAFAIALLSTLLAPKQLWIALAGIAILLVLLLCILHRLAGERVLQFRRHQR